MRDTERLAALDDIVLVTGAAGFLGGPVVSNLLSRGFRRVRCMVRPASDLSRLQEAIRASGTTGAAEIATGNLLSREDCTSVTKGAVLVYHLAAGTGTKAFPDAFLNSVVTLRNLLDAALEHNSLRRFVNVSSFAVYSNRKKPRWRVLDEDCPVEDHPETRAEAYCYAKVKQDELLMEYGEKHNLPYVIVRPGNVYGPGRTIIPGRVGIDSFGPYLNFGGCNPLPLTYAENCADAVVLAGLRPGIDREVFNIIDDDVPTCTQFLRLYQKHINRIRSLWVPHMVSYLFCYAWEKMSEWSGGQLPPVYTRREWEATWKRTRYSNYKAKSVLGWSPKILTAEGLRRFFGAHD